MSDPISEMKNVSAHGYLENMDSGLLNNKKSKKISDLEALVERLQTAMLSLEENNLSLNKKLRQVRDCGSSHCCNTLNAEYTNNTTTHLTDYTSCKTDCNSKRSQFTVVSQLLKDKSVLLDCIDQLRKEKEEIIQATSQQLQDIEARNTNKTGASTESSEMQQQQHSRLDFERELKQAGENTGRVIQIQALLITVQSLKDENVKCKAEHNTLVEENYILQLRFTKREEENKDCMNKLKKMRQMCEEISRQKQDLQDKSLQINSENDELKERLSDLITENQKLKEDLKSFVTEKDRLIQALESVQQHSSLLASDGQRTWLKAAQFVKDKEFLEENLENKMTESKCKHKGILRMLEEVKTNTFNPDLEVKESARGRIALETGIEQVQRHKGDTKEILHSELKVAEAKYILLENSFFDLDKEFQTLSKEVFDLRKSNTFLKEELKICLTDNVELEQNVKSLNTERLLLDNCLRTVENERNVLQFEIRQLHRDYANLRDKIAFHCKNCIIVSANTNCDDLVDEEKHNAQESTVSSCKQNIVESYQDVKKKIAEIQRKLEEEEQQAQSGNNDELEHYRAYSVSCTKSVIQE